MTTEPKHTPLHEMMREPVTNFSRLEPTPEQAEIARLKFQLTVADIVVEKNRSLTGLVGELVEALDKMTDIVGTMSSRDFTIEVSRSYDAALAILTKAKALQPQYKGE